MGEISRDLQLGHSLQHGCCGVGVVKSCVSVRLVAHLAGKAQPGVDVEGAAVEFDRLIDCPSLTIFVSE